MIQQIEDIDQQFQNQGLVIMEVYPNMLMGHGDQKLIDCVSLVLSSLGRHHHSGILTSKSFTPGQVGF